MVSCITTRARMLRSPQCNDKLSLPVWRQRGVSVTARAHAHGCLPTLRHPCNRVALTVVHATGRCSGRMDQDFGSGCSGAHVCRAGTNFGYMKAWYWYSSVWQPCTGCAVLQVRWEEYGIRIHAHLKPLHNSASYSARLGRVLISRLANFHRSTLPFFSTIPSTTPGGRVEALRQ